MTGQVPPLPNGYKLDDQGQNAAPPPPPGYTLDSAPSQGAASSQGSSAQPASWSDRLGVVSPVARTAVDFGEGATSGLASTIFHGGDLIRRGLGMNRVINDPEVQQAMHAPDSTAGHAGKIAEQAAEYLAPGEGWEKAGATLAEKVLPNAVSRIAPAMGRIASQAATTGAINTAQGGDFTRGAIAGAMGGAVGEGMKAVAPTVAEVALGIPNRARKYGAQPGEAVLNDLKGYKPSTLEDEASAKIDALDKQASSIAEGSKTPASTLPALDILNQEIAAAQKRGSPTLLKQLNKIKDQLTTVYDSTGKAVGDLPVNVSADKVRALRQGIDEEIKGWTPPGTKPDSTVESIRKRIYGALSDEAHRTAPETSGLDQEMSSLIPVKNHAEFTANGEGVASQVFKRLKNPTGALVGATGGGALGYKEGGVPGAAAGAAAGLFAPSVISSPTLWTAGARTMYSPRTQQYVLPLMRGALAKLMSGGNQ